MGFYCDEIETRVGDCIAELYQQPLVQEICSLATRVKSIVATLFLQFSEESSVDRITYECKLTNEESYCDCPATTEEFWEQMKVEEIFDGGIDEETLPPVQDEDELLATCFAYVVSIPHWEDQDDFFLCFFVQEVLQVVQQEKGETLRELEGIGQDVDEDSLYISRRKNEILRLLALNRELLSLENRWILDATELIIRFYWKEMHRGKIQRTIQSCACQALSNLPLIQSCALQVLPNLSMIDPLLEDSLILHGNVTVKVEYLPKDIEEITPKVAILTSSI